MREPQTAPRSLVTTRRKGFYLNQEARAGLLFASPFIIGFLIFTAGPLLASLYLSFTSYDVLNPPIWIGLDNYKQMLTDERFGRTLYNTLYFVLFHVPTAIPIALGLALMLNAKVRGLSFWRTTFYLPQITPAVAVGILWLRILSPQNGLLNQGLAAIGIQGPAWTIDADWVKLALIIMKSWSLGWIVVIFLAALQQVPKELYEAAIVDGANTLQRFRHITLPMISGVMFFVFVMLTIFSLNIFTEPMVMFPPQVFGGQMGPQDSALFYVLYLFDQAFRLFHMGYASALAWVLFIISVVIVFFQLRISKRVVYTETSAE
ncbi:MAG: sugar ABC transporter permease [Anaerolineae bacterium]|nr:sugar ABC transporter permease [Anaerolineae bacterium]